MDGIEYLRQLPPWNGKGGFGLDSVRRAAALFGNPQDLVQSIHIAGTNGKGSVSATVASIFGASGARVGLYTSPPLFAMTERIVVDGEPISEKTLNSLALELKNQLTRHSIDLTFFEAITLLFFIHAAAEKLEWMVVEVGLGGRLDATNIIKRPEVAGIVTIDLDHQDILGSSIDLIAREKAGICKLGTKLVVGERKPEARRAIAEISEPLAIQGSYLDREFGYKSISTEQLEYWDKSGSAYTLRPALRGLHQHQNASVASRIAAELEIPVRHIQEGVSGVAWPGRIEETEVNGRRCLIDAGHNPAGMETFANYLREAHVRGAEIGFGALGTKNWREMIDLLRPFVAVWNLLRPESESAAEPTEIASYLSSLGVNATVYGRDYQGFIRTLSQSKQPLLLTGSIYMIGTLRSMLGVESQPIWKKYNNIR